MGKVIGAAEFKAHCLRILDEVQRTGESITVTKRGKPVAEVKPVLQPSRAKLLFGALKGSITFAPDFDPDESPFDPDWEEQWEANNPPELYSKR
ncbi:MAG TPA: type II toxin-antitoxin system prevent-host-death family antitoxin [Allosphingosinicella sp.]|jgi:prevent-host-death family protein